MSWQLQEAKQHFSEVVERARQGEPQIVTKHGKEAAVVVSIEEYRKLTGGNRRLLEYIRSAPDFDLIDLDNQRTKGTGRDVERELFA